MVANRRGKEMRTLIRGAKVLTMDPARSVIHNGAVLMEGDSIVEVDTWEALRKSSGIEQEWGDDDTWVLPGFFCAHYHHDRVFSMGSTDAPLELWLLRASGLDAPPAELEDEFNYLNTLISAIQLVRSGVTTTMDMAWPNNHHPVIQAYLDLGLDLVYAPAMRSQNGYVYEADDKFLSTLPGDLRKRIEGQGLGLTGVYFPATTYFERWDALHSEFGDRIQLVIAPDGPEWCSEDELRLAAKRAAQSGACLHLHNTESPLERQWALHTRGKTMTGYLAEIGFLGSNVSSGHGVWFSEADVELLVKNKAVTVHNPTSNLRLANGIAPVAMYIRAGMTMALGTDGEGLTDRSNFLDEMRLAAYLQRIPSAIYPAPDPWTRGLSAHTVFEMATINGATAFGRKKMGRLQAGYRADLLLLNAKRMSSPYLWTGHDPYDAVLQKAQPEHFDKVISRGRLLLDNGRITTVDEEKLTQRLQSIYETMWKKHDGTRRALIRELEPFFFKFFKRWQEEPSAYVTPPRW
jgi:cytosine/adenosine deaminase-related metal-dependent hydrolase